MTRYRVIEFAELDSTNRHACAHLQDFADGDVIQATVQTDGHGRLSRRWISHVPGNLCVSIVLKPVHALPADLPLANLSQLLSLSVCRALDAHNATATDQVAQRRARRRPENRRPARGNRRPRRGRVHGTGPRPRHEPEPRQDRASPPSTNPRLRSRCGPASRWMSPPFAMRC